MILTASRVPELLFGPGAIAQAGAIAAGLGGGNRALIVADAFLEQSGQAGRLAEILSASGIAATVFSGFSGEPKAAHLSEPVAMARREGVGLVVGLGGGSALDIAKIVACCAAGEADPLHYALAANPLPERSLRKIHIPTTAGTGSEANGIAVFAGNEGKKFWLYGPAAKPDAAILDPELSVSLPPDLTAWCGMDALVHAFESATARRTNRIAQHHAQHALALICGALQRAVQEPADLAARGDMLLGAFHAGYAIENTGTAMGHCISHALAGLGPVHHGLATALAFEATLERIVAAGGPDIDSAAVACGLRAGREAPGFISSLMDAAGIDRRLPQAFSDVSVADLAREMRAPENRPMLKATPVPDAEQDVEGFAQAFLAHVGLAGG